jgi:hypothetical protein
VILDKKGGLKVKKRNLFAVVAMLSVLLLSAGTALAVIGVNDLVPGRDQIVPIVCEGTVDANGQNPVLSGIDTLFAIAEKDGANGEFFELSGKEGKYVVCADVYVFDDRSERRYDDVFCWTAYDVVTDSCSAIIKRMSSAGRIAMKNSSNGKSLFTGYVGIVQRDSGIANSLSNRFVTSAYLTDLGKGFASAMGAPSAEDGTSVFNDLGEAAGNYAVAAESIYPRIFIMNDKVETFNWWMLLLGRNEYTVLSLPAFTRFLDCQVCDEQENCDSETIEIPDELNIINVRDSVPAVAIPACFGTPGCPISGFARCTIREEGATFADPHVVITGTANYPALDPAAPTSWYSLYGYSYQRAAESTATLSWDVIQEIPRVYCSGAYVGTSGSGNDAPCTFTTAP